MNINIPTRNIPTEWITGKRKFVLSMSRAPKAKD